MTDKNQLTDMTIEEVSLVDDPANPGAVVKIVKAKFTPCEGCKDPAACKSKGGCADEMDKGCGDKPVKKFSPANVAAAIAVALEELSPQIVEKAMAEGFSADDEAIATAMAAIIKETVMDLDQVTKALAAAEEKIEALTKRADEAATALAAKDEEIAKLKAPPAQEPSEDEILKSLPEAIRKRLEEGKAAEEKLAKALEKTEVDGFISKAKGYGVGDAAVLGPVLHRIAKGKTTEADATVIEQLLKAAGSIQTHSALFKSLGVSGEGDTDPEAILKSKAEALAKEKGITYAVAYDEVLKANPQIYDDYVAKRRGA